MSKNRGRMNNHPIHIIAILLILQVIVDLYFDCSITLFCRDRIQVLSRNELQI